eukprot:m.2096 g.2096  ORF g.2096 m.2096 type:complete len:95 (+) comp2221_c0_seq1:3-287(+)
MASEPKSNNVLTLKSFSQMIDVVAQLSSKSCDTAAIVSSGEQADTEVQRCDFKYLRPSCGVLQKTSITITEINGPVEVYLSTETGNPGLYTSSQ